MRAEHGQATVEWVGVVALLVVLLAGAAVVLDASWLPRRLSCAIARACDPIADRYGRDVAQLVRAHAPGLVYQRGTLTLPVDFRSCTSHVCSDAPDRPGRARGAATVFTRVVDRRPAGDLFVQYWLYYPDSTYVSAHLTRLVGGSHAGDWESYQVRVGSHGRARARASAHHGYTGARGLIEACQAPLPRRVSRLVDDCDAWTRPTGWMRVTRGSHAGHLVERPRPDERYTPRSDLRLIPIESVATDDCEPLGGTIPPPWCKPVYDEPERDDT